MLNFLLFCKDRKFEKLHFCNISRSRSDSIAGLAFLFYFKTSTNFILLLFSSKLTIESSSNFKICKREDQSFKNKKMLNISRQDVIYHCIPFSSKSHQEKLIKSSSKAFS